MIGFKLEIPMPSSTNEEVVFSLCEVTQQRKWKKKRKRKTETMSKRFREGEDKEKKREKRHAPPDEDKDFRRSLCFTFFLSIVYIQYHTNERTNPILYD